MGETLKEVARALLDELMMLREGEDEQHDGSNARWKERSFQQREKDRREWQARIDTAEGG